MKDIGKKIGLGLIIAYQRLTAWMPPSCRYSPTCSAYTYQAIVRVGLLRGGGRGAMRIGRGNRLQAGGLVAGGS
jgi:putative membrane protein insertion efficiency factor